MENFHDKPLDPRHLERFICRAIDEEFFLEVISLIHNTIEIYLEYNIKKHLYDLKKLEGEDEANKAWNKIEEIKSIKSVIRLAEINYLFSLIDYGLYKDILDFNKGRNKVAHKLLKNAKEGKEIYYRDVKEIAKLGRKIQMTLSPLKHSEKVIQDTLDVFENPKTKSSLNF